MATRDNRDLLGGVLFVTLGFLMLIWAIPYHVDADPDFWLPVDTMPTLVAILFVVLGGLLAGRAVIGVAVRHESKEVSSAAARTDTVRMLLVYAMSGAATLAMSWLPYLTVMPVLVVSLALLFGSRNLTRLLPVAVAPALIFLFVRYGFERLLP